MPLPRGSDVYLLSTGAATPNGGRSYGGGTVYYRAMPVQRKPGISPGALVLGLGSLASLVYIGWHTWRHR